MLTIRGRYADFYCSQIDSSDFKNLQKNGLDSSNVYDQLDDMDALASGISSTDFTLWIDDKCVIESFDALEMNCSVQKREEIDLRSAVKSDEQTFAIVEYSKIRFSDQSFKNLKLQDLAFETQRVIVDDSCELTLIFPIIKGDLIDVSDDIETEAFTGLLISKKSQFKQFDIDG
jgi:hypothetical protein